MEFTTWLTFFAASWAISISPGAGAVAAMTAGMQHGFARGYFLTFGLVLGLWSLLLLVGVGLGALALSQVAELTSLKEMEVIAAGVLTVLLVVGARVFRNFRLLDGTVPTR